MIKRIVMTITLLLICGLVFGCSANMREKKDMNPVGYESEKVTIDERYDVENNTPEVIPPSVATPDGNYLIFDNPGLSSETVENSLKHYTISGRMSANKEGNSTTVYRSNNGIQLRNNEKAVYVVMYGLNDGRWETVDSHRVDVKSGIHLNFYYSGSYETPYYDLQAGTLISVPVTICGETVYMKTALRKTGVRTFTCLFRDRIDGAKDVILGEYVVVSEQRHLLGSFDEAYFADPKKLPKLDDNCEIFAITIELKK